MLLQCRKWVTSGYRTQGNHHFFLAEVSEDGRRIKTIDGNSGQPGSTITASDWKPAHGQAEAWYSYFSPESPNGTGDV